jgi:cytochrome c553
MKKRFFLLTLSMLFCLSVVSHAQKKQSTHQPMVYKIPESLDENVKIEYTKFLDTGQKLYNLYCAKCHGESGEGGKGVPNFTKKELETYQARTAITEGVNKMPSFKEKISEQDLQKVIMFLQQFKK